MARPPRVDYFAKLAEAWRGWTGAKKWHDDGSIVGMSATHDGIGSVQLRVSLTPSPGWNGPGSWASEVVVAIEPGSLEAIATDWRRLLGRLNGTGSG